MDQSTTRECPYCREVVDARAVKCKHCGSALRPGSSEETEGRGWETWKVVHVGEEQWRTGEPEVQDMPPPEVQALVERLSEPGRIGSPGPGGFCVATEVCEPGQIVFGPITIPIQKCRWVIICSGPMPM